MLSHKMNKKKLRFFSMLNVILKRKKLLYNSLNLKFASHFFIKIQTPKKRIKRNSSMMYFILYQNYFLTVSKIPKNEIK